MVKETASDWKRDKAAHLAAALAYYTLLSIAPLVVIVIGVAALAFGEQAAKGQIAAQLGSAVGDQASRGADPVSRRRVHRDARAAQGIGNSTELERRPARSIAERAPAAGVVAAEPITARTSGPFPVAWESSGARS